MKKVTQKAFTLAEIMIVLTVIGILTAIILPSARNLMPDKNLMKFKKAHNTLATAITELVNSDKYYLNGDLGVKPNGDKVQDTDYFCASMSDVLNTKSVDCKKPKLEKKKPHIVALDWEQRALLDSYPSLKHYMDGICLDYIENASKIVLSDGVVIYEISNHYPFGQDIGTSLYGLWDLTTLENEHYGVGFYYIYKPICLDIDGINQNEDPFGYGIRVDGKILVGARAQEWLEKDATQNE